MTITEKILLALHYVTIALEWIGKVWVPLSAFALIVLDKWIPRTDEQWAILFKKRPRWAALAGVLQRFGCSPASAARWMKAVFAGPPPQLSLPQTAEELAAFEAIKVAQLKAASLNLPAPTIAEKAAISLRVPPVSAPAPATDEKAIQ